MTAFQEQIPYTSFLTSQTHLLIERQTPDALGARTVLLPYDQILAVKISDVVKATAFESLGFEGARAAK